MLASSSSSSASADYDRLEHPLDVDEADHGLPSTYTEPATNSAWLLSMMLTGGSIAVLGDLDDVADLVDDQRRRDVVVRDDDRRRRAPSVVPTAPSRISRAGSVTETISPRMLTTPRMKSGTHGIGVTAYSWKISRTSLDAHRVPLLAERKSSSDEQVARPPPRPSPARATRRARRRISSAVSASERPRTRSATAITPPPSAGTVAPSRAVEVEQEHEPVVDRRHTPIIFVDSACSAGASCRQPVGQLEHVLDLVDDERDELSVDAGR